VDPPDDIGRFGDSQNGSMNGPGTEAVYLSLLKRFAITKSIRAEIGMQVSNAFHHSNMQVAKSAGPSQIQLTGRLAF